MLVCEVALTPPGIGLPEQGLRLAINLGRRFACFPGGAFPLSNRNQEFGLLSRQYTTAGLPAAFPDLGEIFADFARQCNSFGRH